jgi:zinc protease
MKTAGRALCVLTCVLVPCGTGLLTCAFAQTEVVRPPVSLPSYKDLKFAPLPPLKLPEPEIFTLPNGMKIYMLEDHELPLVSGTAIIRTGNLFDPSDKRGLAELTGTVQRSGGTKTKTGDQIDVQLENIAASVESGIGESSGTLSFSCLKENTDEVMGVFHDLMTSPEFRQDKVDLAKMQTSSSISRRNDDANGILSREFADIVYGRETPYGWDINYEHVNRIQRQDLIDFYHRYYFPSNILMGIYGDFSIADMKARLTKMFADWNYKQPPTPKFPEVKGIVVPGVFVAEKGDVTQTFFEIGHLGGVLNHKDYPALAVAADILGGGFSSRLFQRVRTKLGYAYNISASWGANYDHPGLFEIAGSTQSKYTVATIKAALEELNRLRTSEVTDEELKTAKDTVLNGFVFHFDRPAKTLNRMLVYAYYEYPKDFIFNYQKALGAVTKADVLRVAQKYLKPQDLTIVAVGNPKDFSTPIAELGLKVQQIDLTIPEAPAPESSTPKPRPDAASQSRAKQLLDRVRQAMGGAEKLASIKDVDYTADVDLQSPGGGAAMKGTQHNTYLLPSSMRQELNLPIAKHTIYSDGTSGWLASPQGNRAMSLPEMQQVQGETFRMLYHLLTIPDANLVADDTLEFSDGKNAARLVVDPKTSLPLKLTYEAAGMSGPAQVEETFSAWKDVNGIKVPFERTVTQAGAKFADVHVREFKFNTGVTPEQLGKKP